MKKKLVITLLATALATTSLAGCGKKETANVPDEGTEVVAEIDTETEMEEVIVEETETEEDTELAELVHNTETEEDTEVVAKGDKTTEKTDVKKGATGTGNTKTDSSKGSNSTSTSTGEISQSAGSSQSTNSGSTSETKPSTQTASTGTTGNETKPNTETSGTQNTTPSTSETQTSTQTTTPSTSETPSEPVVEETQEERVLRKLKDAGLFVDMSCAEHVIWVMNNYGLSEDEAIAVYTDYDNKGFSGYYAYDIHDMSFDPNTLDWSSFNMCNSYYEGKGHRVCENAGYWYDTWVRD